MTGEQFRHEVDYGAALSIARALLRSGLISERELCRIDTILTRRFCPILGGKSIEKP